MLPGLGSGADLGDPSPEASQGLLIVITNGLEPRGISDSRWSVIPPERRFHLIVHYRHQQLLENGWRRE
jgi:hypothetical protein